MHGSFTVTVTTSRAEGIRPDTISRMTPETKPSTSRGSFIRSGTITTGNGGGCGGSNQISNRGLQREAHKCEQGQVQEAQGRTRRTEGDGGAMMADPKYEHIGAPEYKVVEECKKDDPEAYTKWLGKEKKS